jgi:hypothetical protein
MDAAVQQQGLLGVHAGLEGVVLSRVATAVVLRAYSCCPPLFCRLRQVVRVE